MRHRQIWPGGIPYEFVKVQIIFNQGGQGARGQQAQAPRSRPSCAYPKVAKYKGSDDINEAANFTCVAPAKSLYLRTNRNATDFTDFIEQQTKYINL
jgi:hypothetical protein